MSYALGEFITVAKSKYPGLIVDIFNENNKLRLLVSIVEYNGDYTVCMVDNNPKKIQLDPCEKLAIVGKFGDWFYKQHASIYQHIIIENINK